MGTGRFVIRCHSRTALSRRLAATFLDTAADFHSQVELHVSALPTVHPTRLEILNTDH